MSEKILVIDDDKPTVEYVSSVLKRRGFEVFKAHCAQAGLRQAYSNQPDLVLLDVILPDKDGWEMCRQLREMSDVPIIFLSARKDKVDIIKGLDIGADDYVTKPWDDDELVARIHARLRRSPRTKLSEELAFNHGDFRINFMNRELWIRKSLKHLTPKEFNLLAVLVRNAGRGCHAHRTGYRSRGAMNTATPSTASNSIFITCAKRLRQIRSSRNTF